MIPGDIIEDQALGRGMIVYFDVENFPVCAFPNNPDMVLCDEDQITKVINIYEFWK